MKKTLNIMLSLLVLFSFSLTVSSQSSQKDLDQVKLAEVFIGTWKTEVSPDTVVILKFTPVDGGLSILQEMKAKGTTYRTEAGIVGFSKDKQYVISADLWANGNITQDIGRFVSDQLFVSERFDIDQKPARMYIEWEFLSTDTFEWRGKWRGNDMIWGDEWNLTATFTKVKE